MKKFIFTCGDINGIGPEIVIKTLNKIYKQSDSTFSFICPKNVFEFYSKITPPQFDYYYSEEIQTHSKKSVRIINADNSKMTLGKPTKASGIISFTAVTTAAKACINKEFDAMITAPISKESFNKAGINFPGHTELLAELTGSKNYVMMFISENLKAALLTIHIPLSKVSTLVTKKILLAKLQTIVKTLKNDFKITTPQIAILGLNPHAGENGVLGDEEQKIIKPFIAQSSLKKYLTGPFSADAFFANHLYRNYDLTFAMYHDQALIPFKMMNFNEGVNYTAGLPIIRTSPDHGTAFNIAGKNIADENSMLQAFHYAKKILVNRLSND